MSGTSVVQDKQFKQMKFSESLNAKVDMNKVNLSIIKPWIGKRITELLGKKDDVVEKYVINQLEVDTCPDPKKIQLNLTSFLTRNDAHVFMTELWELLLCTQESFVIPSKLNSTNLLNDSFDVNQIHGLRNRLFITFNEFTNVLKNTISPPVFKTKNLKHVKFKECEEQINYENNIVDLRLLISEIKKELKNDNLYDKKNKAYSILRKFFQKKLILCHRSLINTIKLCSKTLDAGIYNPIQSKMLNLIQITSALSLISRKYLYGELFKIKNSDSFDLVQNCKKLKNMLEDSGYVDLEDIQEQSKIPLKITKKKNIATKHTTVSSFKKEYDLENIETAMQIYAPLENYVEDAQQQKILELFEEEGNTIQLCNKEEANNSEKIMKISGSINLEAMKNIGLYIIKKEEKESECKNVVQKMEKCDTIIQLQSKTEAYNSEKTLKISGITESVVDDLITEVISKVNNAIFELIYDFTTEELEKISEKEQLCLNYNTL